MIRSFFAVETPVNKDMVLMQRTLVDKNTKLKLVDPALCHITVKFLGDIEENRVDEIVERAGQAIEEAESFDMAVKGTGVFPSVRKPRVIWAGVEDDGRLKFIAESLDMAMAEMGFKREKRAFKPHVTVARVKKAKDTGHIRDVLNEYRGKTFAELTVRNVKLKKSTLTPQGPVYEDLAAIELK